MNIEEMKARLEIVKLAVDIKDNKTIEIQADALEKSDDTALYEIASLLRDNSYKQAVYLIKKYMRDNNLEDSSLESEELFENGESERVLNIDEIVNMSPIAKEAIREYNRSKYTRDDLEGFSKNIKHTPQPDPKREDLVDTGEIIIDTLPPDNTASKITNQPQTPFESNQDKELNSRNNRIRISSSARNIGAIRDKEEIEYFEENPAQPEDRANLKNDTKRVNSGRDANLGSIPPQEPYYGEPRDDIREMPYYEDERFIDRDRDPREFIDKEQPPRGQKVLYKDREPIDNRIDGDDPYYYRGNERRYIDDAPDRPDRVDRYGDRFDEPPFNYHETRGSNWSREDGYSDNYNRDINREPQDRYEEYGEFREHHLEQHPNQHKPKKVKISKEPNQNPNFYQGEELTSNADKALDTADSNMNFGDISDTIEKEAPTKKKKFNFKTIKNKFSRKKKDNLTDDDPFNTDIIDNKDSDYRDDFNESVDNFPPEKSHNKVDIYTYPPIPTIEVRYKEAFIQYPPIVESDIIDKGVEDWLDRIKSSSYTENDIKEIIDEYIYFLEERELDISAQYLLLAGVTDSSYGKFMLARELFKGRVLRKNINKSYEIMSRLARIDNFPDAICDLGQFYEYGIVVNRNKKKAYQLYKKALELNVDRAQRHLERVKDSIGLFNKIRGIFN